jgi:aldehyde:ferredoxin oxidoreductase
MHEPRGKKGMGLTYATSNRGASHLEVYHDDSFTSKSSLAPEIGIDSSLVPQKRTETGARKVRLVKISEDLMGLYNSLVVCRFVFYPAGITIPSLVKLCKVITGWDASPTELMKIGERSVNITRCFNAREGFTRADDVLPPRVMEPLKEGSFEDEGFAEDILDSMLTQYYAYRGWDQTRGWPTKQRLEALELGWMVKELSLR